MRQNRKVSNMKINHNMSATITNAQLLKTENSLAASMERLLELKLITQKMILQEWRLPIKCSHR